MNRLVMVGAIVISLIPLSMAVDAKEEPSIGVIVLGHGDPTPGWAESIVELTEQADLGYPTEVAFLEMVPEYTLEGAIERLEARGVNTIIVVPLLISSHHSHGYEMEYLLGLREGISSKIIKPVETDCDIILTPGMNGHPLIGELLLEKALELSLSPSDEIVVFLVHGADLGWELFQANMDSWCDFVKANGDFKDVRYGVMSPTFSMPSVIWDAKKDGNVIAIPLVLAQGMYSEMLFPMLSILGAIGIGVVAKPVSLGISYLWPLIPEGIMDPLMMLGMVFMDAMMEMMMSDGEGGVMDEIMEIISRILLKGLASSGIQYTAEGLVPHPRITEWIREMVVEAMATT
jgi:hypothetical protein